jgi:hypothetical protein
MPKFISNIAKSNFNIHIQRATVFVKIPAKIIVFISEKVGRCASKVPFLSTVLDSSISLIAMHNSAANSGLNLTSTLNEQDFQSCEFNNELGQILDLVIVGSGPGGSIVAKEANKSGVNFLIVEKGKVVNSRIPSHSALQLFENFRHGGQEAILSWPIIPFAQGECLGGGSEINSGLYHNLPGHVSETWQRITGIPKDQFKLAELQVFKNLEIQVQNSTELGVYVDSPLLKMKKTLNWEGHVIPRWRKYDGASNYLHFGMRETYLSEIKENHILLNHEVIKISIVDNTVKVHIKGIRCNHLVLTRKVCLSAGTVASPTILINSDLAKTRDFKFKFHLMAREVAKFNYLVNDMKDIDPHQIWSQGGLLKIGAAVGTKDMLSATLASKGCNNQKDFTQIASYYISIPSEGRSGFIRIRKSLLPYFIPSRKMKRLARLAQGTLQDAIKDSGGTVLGSGKPSFSSVHVFGSIPIGSSRVIDGQGYVKGTDKKVFIRDASILPTHPLVNPQGPIMHLVTALELNRNNE